MLVFWRDTLVNRGSDTIEAKKESIIDYVIETGTELIINFAKHRISDFLGKTNNIVAT